MTTKIVSFVSPKGGVGKTTICANMAALLSALGYKVLMIDADSQPSLTNYYDHHEDVPGGIFNMILNKRISDNDITKTIVPNLDIVKSNGKDGAMIVSLLQQEYQREKKLSNILRNSDLEYDYIFIDTQGATGLLQDLGIVPADILISPLEPTVLTVREFMRKINELVSRYEEDEELVKRNVQIYVLINKANNYKASEEIRTHIANLSPTLSSRIHFLTNKIPLAKSYQISAQKGCPAHQIEPSRNGPMKSASAALHHVVWEIWPELRSLVISGSDANNVPEDKPVISDQNTTNKEQ